MGLKGLNSIEKCTNARWMRNGQKEAWGSLVRGGDTKTITITTRLKDVLRTFGESFMIRHYWISVEVGLSVSNDNRAITTGLIWGHRVNLDDVFDKVKTIANSK